MLKQSYFGWNVLFFLKKRLRPNLDLSEKIGKVVKNVIQILALFCKLVTLVLG